MICLLRSETCLYCGNKVQQAASVIGPTSGSATVIQMVHLSTNIRVGPLSAGLSHDFELLFGVE